MRTSGGSATQPAMVSLAVSAPPAKSMSSTTCTMRAIPSRTTA